MKTLLNQTTPADAYEIFTKTYDFRILAKKLDDATIPFFNAASIIQSSDSNKITEYANNIASDDFLDILAICHLKNCKGPLYLLRSEIKDYLNKLEKQIEIAKYNTENSIKWCDEDLLDAEKYALTIAQRKHTNMLQQLNCANAIISLLNKI